VGANFVSATFEDVCTLLVGASGAVFGFMGLFIADLIVNFESISWPFVRVLTILLFIVFFVANALIERNGSSGNARNVSHASHIGGLICGLFPSMLFLPNLRDKRLRAVQRQLQEEAVRNTGDTRPQCAQSCPLCLPTAPFRLDRICHQCLQHLGSSLLCHVRWVHISVRLVLSCLFVELALCKTHAPLPAGSRCQRRRFGTCAQASGRGISRSTR
jgi:Rhomboid family